MTGNTGSSIDIAYSTSVKEESIHTLRSEIESRVKTSVTTRVFHQHSLKTPMTISILLTSASWLLRLLELPEYFKTSTRDRSSIDSRNADDRRTYLVRPSHWLVKRLSENISNGISVTIGLHIPPETFENYMTTDHFGGLLLRGTTKEVIATELEVFLRYIPALDHLIDVEIAPKPILGGVNLKLLDDGLEVTWVPQETLRKHIRVLGPDDRTARSRDQVLKVLRSHKAILEQRFGISEIALFGSFARDQADDHSDVDILIGFTSEPDWKSYFGAQVFLEDLLGRPVDLAINANVRAEMRPYVEREAVDV